MRNLKAIGLALVAALAFSAMAAAAQAETADFWANANPAQIEVTGESNHIVTVNNNTPYVCGTGQAGETTKSVHGKGILSGVSALTLTAENIEYTNCHTISFGITFPVTVDMNGCDYHFTAGTMTSSTTAEGSAEIKCPMGEEMTVAVFNSGDTNHEEAPRCTIHVPPQNVQGAITYHNITHEGKMAVTASTTAGTAVTATKTDENTFGCNTHEHDASASYSGSFIAIAEDEAGNQVDMTVISTP